MSIYEDTKPNYCFSVTREKIGSEFYEYIDDSWMIDDNYEVYELHIMELFHDDDTTGWYMEPWAFSSGVKKSWDRIKLDEKIAYDILLSLINACIIDYTPEIIF